MKTTQMLLIALTATSFACGDETDASLMASEQAETDTIRQALPSADDVAMEYSATASANALAGDLSGIAAMTGSAIVGTNSFMIAHFRMMEKVSNLPPTEEGPGFRAWQGEHNDLTLRVEAKASPAPRGIRYDYTVKGLVTADGGDFLPIIDGHVVRFADAFAPRDGAGIVRFHFSNLNTLEPERDVAGTLRVAFRKANHAHQVHARAIGIETPDDPNFPKAAEYIYGVRPDRSGAMRWFSKSDVLKDGAPYENVAVHSMWRDNKSGVGSAVVVGGSLDVDYWHLVECWASNFVKGYELLSVPDANSASGDAATCFAPTGDLNPPAMEDNLPDEDPEIPAPMPEEEQD